MVIWLILFLCAKYMPAPTRTLEIKNGSSNASIKYYNMGGDTTLVFFTPDAIEPTFRELMKASARKKINLISIESEELTQIDIALCEALREMIFGQRFGLVAVNGFCEPFLKLAKLMPEHLEFLLFFNCQVEFESLTDDELTFDIPIRIFSSKWDPRLDIDAIQQLGQKLSQFHRIGRGQVIVENYELLWHNYDTYNQQFVIEFINFITNHYYLPTSLEIQEYRTLFLFIAFFVLYYLCDHEDRNEVKGKKN